MHPQPIIASILVCGVIAVVATRKRVIEAARVRRENEAFREYFISWGDVPFVPKGLRLSGRQPGGGQSLTEEPVTVDVRTHRGATK